MPRQPKPPRLYLRKPRRPTDLPRWVIKDGSVEIGTGFGPSDRAGAEKQLAQYLAAKHKPERRHRELHEIDIADVINIYLTEVVPGQVNKVGAAGRAERLLEFFGNYSLADISGSLCREYVQHRGNEGGARRDLQDLSAAIGHHRKEGFHRELVTVVLPSPGKSRLRWLSRSEVARLVWVCLTTRESQNGIATKRRPLKHIARFVMIGVYTGSRPSAILGLSWDNAEGRGYVDLDHGLIYRHASGEAETTKRQTPVPISPKLHRLLRLWARADNRHGPVIRFDGEPIKSVKTALGRAVKLAGLDTSVTSYTLRHTTGSWLIQKGVSTRKTAEILGTSEAMIERHYGHLAPNHLRDEIDLL